MGKMAELDKIELERLLKKAFVRKEEYNLSETGWRYEKLCLARKGEKWQVYYEEHGKKTTNEIFDTESDACHYIYEELVGKSQNRFRRWMYQREMRRRER